MPFLPSLPKGASLLDLFKAFPDTSIPLIQFHEALLRRPSPFTEGERELIAAYVSGLNHCRYCHGVHSATAELLGIKRELVDSRIDIDGADVDLKMRPVLRYDAKPLYHGLVEGRGLVGLIASIVAGCATLALLWWKRYEASRYTGSLAVAAIIAGWALAQSPVFLEGLTV